MPVRLRVRLHSIRWSVQASVVAEVPLQWPPLPPSQARSGVVAAAVSLAPLLTRSAAAVCRKSATLLRAAAASPVNGVSTHTRSPAEAPPNGYANGSTGDASPSAAVAVPAQRGERKVVWLSPLQWVVAAGAGAVPTDVVDGQLRRLLHDVLACAPQKGGLGLIPRMPLWNGRGALNACSVELYILRQCAAVPCTPLRTAASLIRGGPCAAICKLQRLMHTMPFRPCRPSYAAALAPV